MELPEEDDSTLNRAWDMVTALSAASTASSSTRSGDLSPELSAAIIAQQHPELQAQILAAAAHCDLANRSLGSPTCNWEQVRVAWKYAPNATGVPHAVHMWNSGPSHLA